MITKTALARAGIRGFARQGAHIFRHSLATELLRSGATLSEIGQLLRHERHDTTRIYEGGYRCTPDIEPAVDGRCAMTGLLSALERYLSMRQGLGYKYPGGGAPSPRFRFVYGGEQGHDHHDKAGLGMGDFATPKPSVVGHAVDRRSWFRATCREHRSEDGPPTGILPQRRRPKP
jgi:hypothetical protein